MLEKEYRQRGIPLYRVSSTPRVDQLGQGAAGRHFYGSASEADTLTALALSKNKVASRELVQALGYPHTRQVVVHDLPAALRAVKHVGYPCVVKPIDGGQGYGITVGVSTPFEMERAFAAAKRRTQGGVVIEQFVRGDDHRMGVFGGRLCWVYRRRATTVKGDGRSTIRELLAAENDSRDDALVIAGYYEKIVADEAMEHFLARQGYRMDSVPDAGREVALRSQANISQGGLIKDFSAVVHPDNIAMAEHIARAARITACGLDFITTDVTRSWREGDCAVIEINCTPAFSGSGDTCLRMYSGGEIRGQGRIPTWLVVGDDELAAVLAGSVGRRGLTTGLATVQASRLGSGQLFTSGKGELSARIKALILHTETEALVIGCSVEEIELRGLPLDRFDLALVAAPVAAPMRALLDDCATRVVDGPADEAQLDSLARQVLDGYPVSRVEPLVTVQAGAAEVSRLTVIVRRPACIPWQALDTALEAQALPPFPHDPGTTVVCRRHLPLLTWRLATSVLHDAGLPVPPEPIPVCDVAWPDCLVREFPYHLSFVGGEATEGMVEALHWAAEAVNLVFDGIMFGGRGDGLAASRRQLVLSLARPGQAET